MNRVGLLLEGSIEEELLPPLLEDTLRHVLRFPRGRSPLFIMPFPPNGYGEIPKNLRTLIHLYRIPSERARLGCGLFIIIHDSRKTEKVQKEVRRILREAPAFPAVYGLAIQETEAWVLGDIHNVNRRVFRVYPTPELPSRPERDPDPKKTLTDSFVKRSSEIEFDRWNPECARRVAPYLRRAEVAAQCPKGFGALMRDLGKARQYIRP